MTLTADGRARVLSNGVEMPLLGLGVWQLGAGRPTEQAVLWALEAGYRHIDTARLYRNEQSVGAALRASGLPREEVFVATKFQPRDPDPERAAEESLRLLDLDYVDLYLIHWPTGDPRRGWDAMERVAERKLARAVGVSNYGADQLAALVGSAQLPPAVNQVEFSPFQRRTALLEACERSGVVLEAYSPLTRGRELRDTQDPGGRGPGRPDPRAGAAAVGGAARHPGDPEVGPPGADRGERGDLRLHAVRAGPGGAGRAGPDRRHRLRPVGALRPPGRSGVARQGAAEPPAAPVRSPA